MPDIQELVAEMRRCQKGVRYRDAERVRTAYFGQARMHGSHHVYRMPWKDDPRINIQNKDGYVSPYQVKQILAALDRWESEHVSG